ncbi:four helix bundle protein [Marinilabiliaceae bacterium JC017]|nr:four helix bundle protein [Marinilabiliaceae bacterium JC017]
MYSYGFEKLEVWQLSRKLAKDIYQTTSKFPEEEKFGFISQLRRATVSVSSNIAEGNSRKSTKDKAHFMEMSFSSLMEVINQLILATDLRYISTKELNEYRNSINELSNKLNAFWNSLKR